MYRPIVNYSFLLGLLNIFLSILHLCLSFFMRIDRNNINLNLENILWLIQTLVPSGILLFVGITLLRHGWRMARIIRLTFLVMNVLIIYYMIKDLAVYQS
jgi:hypothetical protein